MKYVELGEDRTPAGSYNAAAVECPFCGKQLGLSNYDSNQECDCGAEYTAMIWFEKPSEEKEG
jgi:hypothetical protein